MVLPLIISLSLAFFLSYTLSCLNHTGYILPLYSASCFMVFSPRPHWESNPKPRIDSPRCCHYTTEAQSWKELNLLYLVQSQMDFRYPTGLMHPKGVEPLLSAWRADGLPLTYGCMRKLGIEPKSTRWQRAILPLNYSRKASSRSRTCNCSLTRGVPCQLGYTGEGNLSSENIYTKSPTKNNEINSVRL